MSIIEFVANLYSLSIFREIVIFGVLIILGLSGAILELTVKNNKS